MYLCVLIKLTVIMFQEPAVSLTVLMSRFRGTLLQLLGRRTKEATVARYRVFVTPGYIQTEVCTFVQIVLLQDNMHVG